LVTLIVGIILAVGFIPLVQYKQSVAVPGFPYKFTGFQACEIEFGHIYNSTNGQGINITNQTGFNHCIQKYRWLPINVTGGASLSYKFLGIGVPPFPSMMNVSEDSFHAILFTNGTRIVAGVQVNPDTLYDPPGIIIDNLSLSMGSFGQSNVTVSFTNGTSQTISGAWIILSTPSDSGNSTDNEGVTWMSLAPGPLGSPCLVVNTCRT
jgi:hypothetical protein